MFQIYAASNVKSIKCKSILGWSYEKKVRNIQSSVGTFTVEMQSNEKRRVTNKISHPIIPYECHPMTERSVIP